MPPFHADFTAKACRMSQPFPTPDCVNVMLARKLADLLSMSVNEVLSLCDRFDRRVEYQYRIALITIADFAAFFPARW
jgi:hypothetical protein